MKEVVPSAAALRRALARVRDGKTLDPTEAEILLHARGDDLEALLDHASRIRDAGLAAAGRPGVITYSRKVFIPLTRLCRDRCHYCTFATAPAKLSAPYLSPDEVLEIARQGAALGCKEALFTLGDRPEDRWPQARAWLDEQGYDDTLSYVRAMAIRVLEETGLLPHLNPGVLTWSDFQRLKPVAPSMGMMLETTARRLFTERGQVHYGSPDKDPVVRLRVLEDAGRSTVPFTTGILIGIGETLAERVDSIFAIRKIARQYGAIQEVIVQNFRAKPDTALRDWPDADLEDLAATIAVTRILLGPKAHIQAPPNLITDDGTPEQGTGDEFTLMLRAGIDDWGGVSPLTPDHVNPERPWPQIDLLAERTAAAGFTLRERLTVYPEYVRQGEPWIDPRLHDHVAVLADPETGLARPDAVITGRPWQEPASLESGGRTNLHKDIDTAGRSSDRRGDFDSVYGDWSELRARIAQPARDTRAPHRFDPEIRAALRRAEDDPAGITDRDALALLAADGPELEALADLADRVRRDTVGDEIFVVTRNINFTNVCYRDAGSALCAARTDADAYTLSLDRSQTGPPAWEAGAARVCMQAGSTPTCREPPTSTSPGQSGRTPDMHIRVQPHEVMNGVSLATSRSANGCSGCEAGLDSLPALPRDPRRRRAGSSQGNCPPPSGSRSSPPPTTSASHQPR